MAADITPWVDTDRGGRNFYEREKRSIEEADEAEVAARGAGAP
jgi:hypothetical protein